MKDKLLSDDYDWHARQAVTDTVPLIDAGQGKPLVLRAFEFAINPEFKGKIDKQDIFNMHWRQISTLLWGDGLVPRKEVDPRVVIGKKKYRIFVLAEPRLNTMIVDKPRTLQDLTRRKKSANL